MKRQTHMGKTMNSAPVYLETYRSGELARRVVSLAFERWPARTPEAVARGG